MTNLRMTAAAIAIMGSLCVSQSGFAQSAMGMPQHVPLQKTIGQSKTGVVPSLIVFNARGANLQGDKLVLTGIAPNSIVFADRPVRAAGHDTTTILQRISWTTGQRAAKILPRIRQMRPSQPLPRMDRA